MQRNANAMTANQEAQSRASVGARKGVEARREAHAVESFSDAMAALYDPLVRRLVLVLRDVGAAEDVAQDAYLRAFKSWHRFDGQDPRAWLYTIALRLAFNELRRRRRAIAFWRRPAADSWVDTSDPDLWAALARLDGRVRAALLMHVLDGYSHREIAKVLGVAEGTVSSWLSRARVSLRSDLAGEIG